MTSRFTIVARALAAGLLCAAAVAGMQGASHAEESAPQTQGNNSGLGDRYGVNGRDNGEDTLEDGAVVHLLENVTRRPLYLPGEASASQVHVYDTLTGAEIPLTGKGVVSEEGRARVLLPQLPAGVFAVSTPFGEATIEVGDREVVGAAQRQLGGFPWWLLVAIVPVVAGTAVVLRRRGTGVAVLGCSAVAGILVGAGMALYVLGSPSTDPKDCGEDPCRVLALVDAYDRGGAAGLETALNNFVHPTCHQVAHEVGYVLWRRGSTLEDAVKRMVPGCEMGVVHGTTEAMAVFSSDADFTNRLEKLCGSLANERNLAASCFHGGGHATVWRTNGDLARAYELCDEVANPYGTFECHGSAVMEWADRWEDAKRNGVEGLVSPAVEQPMQVCLEGPDDDLFRAGCYIGTNHRVSTPADVVKWCNTKEPHTVSCFSALGENLPYFSEDRKLSEQVPVAMVNQLSVPDALTHLEFCYEAADTKAVETCARQVARIMAWQTKSEAVITDLCSKYPSDQRAWCTEETGTVLSQLRAVGGLAG